METKKPELIALFDLDSTLADFNRVMDNYMKAMAGPTESPALWNGDRDEMPAYIRERRSLVKKLPGFWEHLPPISTGMAIFDLVGELGFERHVLTKGPKRSTAAWTEKVLWCQREIPNTPINISMDKGLVYGRILVDDWPPYIMRWLKWRPRGLVVMLDWPHNRTIKNDHGEKVFFEHPNIFRFYQDVPHDEMMEQFAKLKERLIEARDR